MPFTLTRSVLVVLVPGLIAVVPWSLLLAFQMDDLAGLYKTYSVLVNGALVASAVVVGALIESSVSYVEVRWDREREREYQVRKNWFDYLSLHSVGEPIGFRYLGRMVTAMYFELAMMVASPIFVAGASLLVFLYVNGPWRFGAAGSIIIAPATALFFYLQAKTTHLVLCDARREINNRLRNGTKRADPKAKTGTVAIKSVRAG